VNSLILRSALVLALSSCAAGASIPPPAAPPPKCANAAEGAAPAAVSAAAKVTTAEEAIARMFAAPKVDADWFTPAFIAQVSTEKIDAIMADIRKDLGPFVKVEKNGDAIHAVLARGKVPVKTNIDADGRITTLWFSPPEMTEVMSNEAISAELRALPGKVSVLVSTDGKDVLAHDADVPLAVGSAFKLAILDVLRARIEATKARWTDVVRLDPKHKSLPSGVLHTWPDRAPLTLHTLASLMISQSDNTATDVLLDYVGRNAVEKVAPGNTPFMSTRDAFALKVKSNAALLTRWREADETARKKMLSELAAATLEDADLSSEPTVDVEWMFTARKLCELLSRNKDLDATHINPGLAQKKDWDLIAYKGGSEPGVLNYATYVEKGRRKHCVITTWNDATKDVDAGKLGSLHGALLRGLRERK
jgi:beta-lactamase class A